MQRPAALEAFEGHLVEGLDVDVAVATAVAKGKEASNIGKKTHGFYDGFM